MKKKVLVIFVALLLALGLFTGCGGKYIPPRGDDGFDIDPGNNGGGSTDTDNSFTVTLVLDGEPFAQTDGMRAVWSDGITRPAYANFEDGVAKTTGLDGDYRVTLEGLPSAYTYDPNGNYATNYSRDLKITIYNIITVRIPGSQINIAGRNLDNAVELNSLGAYRVTLTGSLTPYYYMYAPTRSGTYTVKSLVNISDNNINPKYQVCSGSRYGIRRTGEILDGGGASSTYTVNFNYEYYINADNVSSGGGVIMLFGILAESRTLQFPLTVDILLTRDGDYVRDDINAEMVRTQEFADVESSIVFPAFPEIVVYPNAGYTEYCNLLTQRRNTIAAMPEVVAKRNAADSLMKQTGTRFNYVYESTENVLDGSLVKFNENTGYYHLYSERSGYGAVLCAKISEASEVMDAFNGVEYNGNKALTVNDNYDYWYRKTQPKYSTSDPVYLNYKVFIEGFSGISSHEGPPPESPTGIAAQYVAYSNWLGYSDFVNSDGVYPVTEELKRFLQGYATQARIFNDGNGFAEPGLMSAEEDQWLFACGYYR